MFLCPSSQNFKTELTNSSTYLMVSRYPLPLVLLKGADRSSNPSRGHASLPKSQLRSSLSSKEPNTSEPLLSLSQRAIHLQQEPLSTLSRRAVHSQQEPLTLSCRVDCFHVNHCQNQRTTSSKHGCRRRSDDQPNDPTGSLGSCKRDTPGPSHQFATWSASTSFCKLRQDPSVHGADESTRLQKEGRHKHLR